MSSETPKLQGYNVATNQHSISGLSSGAYMAVQLHLAHSSHFVGLGIIAGGPYRCVESFRDAANIAEDAYALNAIYICMTPLTAQTGPRAKRLADLARQTAAAGKIDPIENLAGDRLYIFTGALDPVVNSLVVRSTRDFYLDLGVPAAQIKFIDTVPAGHSIITDNIEDSPLAATQPPYINNGGFMQSHDILRHIYGDLKPPFPYPTGQLIRFKQSEFINRDASFASMAEFGYVYVPRAVQQGETARGVHIALHGSQQGYNYVNLVGGLPDTAFQPAFGNRYMTTTGYNQIADSNNLIVLYPQAAADDGNQAQNPEGSWDWWGYSSPNPRHPDYYSKDAVQIRAIYNMLEQLCSGRPSTAVTKS